MQSPQSAVRFRTEFEAAQFLSFEPRTIDFAVMRSLT
jgi:hypothetical protein